MLGTRPILATLAGLKAPGAAAWDDVHKFSAG